MTIFVMTRENVLAMIIMVETNVTNVKKDSMVFPIVQKVIF